MLELRIKIIDSPEAWSTSRSRKVDSATQFETGIVIKF